ncbi:hypothetical protein [Mesorhizobium sp. M1D.F.Ca.ET.043.01.1.1]|uniref:hypothetical protein n=1 Tax=Mesorhizobium sp. M1D.F.Ca.ET.043.01.1.1 TaxID=2493669 RepID=UPI001677FBFD|nr:hypothetical protein [Mesorhizobium sp. M1D.F.Ca.ET.043.01.1.1]
MKKETEAEILWQEDIEPDVLVHGDFERNDMVQHFGEQLVSGLPSPNAAGCKVIAPATCALPSSPDASRPDPMTSRWWQLAQSMTEIKCSRARRVRYFLKICD